MEAFLLPYGGRTRFAFYGNPDEARGELAVETPAVQRMLHGAPGNPAFKTPAEDGEMLAATVRRFPHNVIQRFAIEAGGAVRDLPSRQPPLRGDFVRLVERKGCFLGEKEKADPSTTLRSGRDDKLLVG